MGAVAAEGKTGRSPQIFADGPMTRRSFRFGSNVLAGLLVLLFGLLINLAPLALGSNRPLPWAYNASLAGMLMVAVVLWHTAERFSGSATTLKPILLPLTLFALVMIWAAIQTVPMPEGYLPNPLWQVASEYEPSIAGSSVSVNPGAGIESSMRLLTYACIFLSVYLLAANPERASVFLWLFAGSACLYALYGLARFSLDWSKILWFNSPSTRLTGPFLGQNNAATYYGLGLVCALALFLQAYRRSERGAARSSLVYRATTALQALSGKPGFILVMVILMLVALLLTTSRAGIAASVAGCATLILLQIVRSRNRGGEGAVRFAGLAVVGVLFLLVLEMSGGRFAERILSGEQETGSRFDVYRMTWSAIADNSWTGTGLGTFQDIFPLYRDDVLKLGQTWDKAHNDYLELVIGLGVPAALVFLAALLSLFVTVVRGYFRRRRNSIYCGVAVSACVVVGLHGLVDFSLQIQAVAMAFAMLLALGAAQSQSSTSTHRS